MGFKSRRQTDAKGHGVVIELARQQSLNKRFEPNSLARAQELIYESWEASTWSKRLELAKLALSISPNCADAYVILAEATDNLGKATELYREGVFAGERALGPDVFEQDVGHFWGILETRPYMRARAGLARCLWEAGQHDDAVRHYHELLRLNPNDNQGTRYVLAAGLASIHRNNELRDLLAKYEDGTASWLYAQALLAFRESGDCNDSQRARSQAKTQNPYVVAYLVGEKCLPDTLPDFVGFGDEREAMCCAADWRGAWTGSPGAVEWLSGS